MNFDNI